MKKTHNAKTSLSIIDNSAASREKRAPAGSIADWAYQQFFDLSCQVYQLGIKNVGPPFLLKIQQLQPFRHYLTDAEQNDLDIWKSAV